MKIRISILLSLAIICLISMIYVFKLMQNTTTNKNFIVNLQPIQKNINIKKEEKIFLNGFLIEKIKKIEVNARVLSTKKYKDNWSKISPMDFALGWKEMSDEKILKYFKINQKHRWYFWKEQKPILKKSIVINNSSNWHIVPSTKEIKEELKTVKKNDIITMEGYLINIISPEGKKIKLLFQEKIMEQMLVK